MCFGGKKIGDFVPLSKSGAKTPLTGKERNRLLMDRLWDLSIREGAPNVYNLTDIEQSDVSMKLKTLIKVLDYGN